jgi:hypothetical protein
MDGKKFQSVMINKRSYNHLGNVNAVITDRRFWNATTLKYEAGVEMKNDYYPFGMEMPLRQSGSNDYRYGYNGMEVDNEVSGNGNSYTTEFRQYSLSRNRFSSDTFSSRSKIKVGNPRLGRWKSLDPLMAQFPWQSPYCAFDNNPIFYKDPTGQAAEESDGWIGKKDANGDVNYTFDKDITTPEQAKKAGYDYFIEGGENGTIRENASIGDGPIGDVYIDNKGNASYISQGVTVTPNKQSPSTDQSTTSTSSASLDNPWNKSGDNQSSGGIDFWSTTAGLINSYTSPKADFIIGAAENKIGQILLDRGKYGGLHPETIIRTPVANISVSTKLLQNTGTALKWGGRAFGAFGLVGTYAQWQTGTIGNTEAALDATFGAIGFLPGYGWAVSGAYFLIVKPLYNYSTKP